MAKRKKKKHVAEIAPPAETLEAVNGELVGARGEGRQALAESKIVQQGNR